MSHKCFVCSTEITKPSVYLDRPTSLTSMCTLVSRPTLTYVCPVCAHAQSPVLDDAAGFYADSYDILINSDDEDQIVSRADNGEPIYRLQHQANVALRSVPNDRPVKILDYGAAKGASLRQMVQQKNNIEPFFFDVSDHYVPFWQQSVPESNYATFSLPASWDDTFDLAVSFFVLEHVVDLATAAADVHRALVDDGVWHIVVPSPLDNSGDLVVVDHTHHFSPTSIRFFLEHNGFGVLSVRRDIHDGALVVEAQKGSATGLPSIKDTQRDIELAQIVTLCDQWNSFEQRVRDVETTIADQSVAIYGAGFYGSLVYSLLDNQSNVVSFVDRNPHLQKLTRFGLPIVDPQHLDPTVTKVISGLRPTIARNVLSDVAEWRDRSVKILIP